MEGDIIILVYIDDCIIVSKSIYGLKETLKIIEQRYAIIDTGEMNKYLGK